jgi:hypothetical protein
MSLSDARASVKVHVTTATNSCYAVPTCGFSVSIYLLLSVVFSRFLLV